MWTLAPPIGVVSYHSIMESNNRRKICKGCGEELGNTAYYRHLKNGCECPESKKIRLDNTVDDSTSDEESCLSSNISDLDTSTSTFSLSSEASSFAYELKFPDKDIPCFDSCDSFSMSTSEESAASCQSDDEIWDIDSISNDSEEEADSVADTQDDEKAKDMIIGISVFLNFLHLTFHLSERAMSALLLFLRVLLQYIVSVIGGHPVINALLHMFPKSLYSIRKFIKSDCEITEFVVCPNCDNIYSFADCVTKYRNEEMSKQCKHIEFPNHKYRSRRSKCNTLLLKQIKVRSKTKLVPRKTFVYRSIISYLRSFVKRKGFLQKCELWRKRVVPTDTLSDVYDGDVWKDLNYIDGQPFLASPGNFCLTLNIDWFNPFKEAPYSAGAIYLVIQNLPGTERYKLENIMLVGIIPGPKEPKTMDHYLKPLVGDLNKLFIGVKMKNSYSLFGETTIRAIVSCVVCDLPAVRKVCGFLSYVAKFGCSKCLKEFPRMDSCDKNDFSGYDYELWTERDTNYHMQIGIEAKNAESAKARCMIESSHGARYSEIFNLTYFNVVRFHIIDPMHNLFLGIAKHTVTTWKKTELLKDKHFEILQSRVDSITPPPGIGRIPRKIGAAFSSFTADEWKNWTLLYSVYSLHGVIPDDDYQCWLIFVDACRHLCQLTITRNDVELAHKKVIQFCKRFQELYGEETCTPNMHMVCHLKSCMLDYGPLAAFWAFAFERYNGTLEGLQKSWKGPEKQMFKKFLGLQSTTAGEIDLFSNQNSLTTSMIRADLIKAPKLELFSSVNQSSYNSLSLVHRVIYYNCPVSSIDATINNDYILSQPKREKCLTDSELLHLEAMYKKLYTDAISIKLARFYFEHKQLTIHGEEYISTHSLSKRSAVIVAHWPHDSGDIDSTGTAQPRVGKITSFLTHIATLKTAANQEIVLTHCLSRMQWLQSHTQNDFFGPSVIVSTTIYDSFSPAAFMPVSRIAGRCAFLNNLKYTFDCGEDKICLAMPVFKKVLSSDIHDK